MAEKQKQSSRAGKMFANLGMKPPVVNVSKEPAPSKVQSGM